VLVTPAVSLIRYNLSFEIYNISQFISAPAFCFILNYYLK
jgi:hypothetical protein